jgi:AraC-like DNA-binding protein
MPSAQFTSPTLSGTLLNAPDRQLFTSRDLAQTRTLVGQVMKPHRLEIHGHAQELNSRMHYMGLGGVALSRLKYGADVDIEPGCLDDFFLIQMPLAGQATIESGDERIVSNTDVAAVISPNAPTLMRWSADADQLMVRIDRQLVERAIYAQTGRPDAEPVRFQLDFAWRASDAWRCALLYLSECASNQIDPVKYRLLIANIEQLVVSTLLASQPHNLSDLKGPRRTAVLPRHVRRVEDFLREHAHEPICADQLAQLAGVSLRSLYAGFREYRGISPLQYLRNLRLDGARQTLLAEPDSNIASVAMRWGFSHLGRFSIDYKMRFGESPSQSLRRPAVAQR